jgi:hypothetical protein
MRCCTAAAGRRALGEGQQHAADRLSRKPPERVGAEGVLHQSDATPRSWASSAAISQAGPGARVRPAVNWLKEVFDPRTQPWYRAEFVHSDDFDNSARRSA